MTEQNTDQTDNTLTKDAPAENKLLAVASGKGGVGKTWFSITLSHTLAQQGKRVLLFDGDLGLANVDVQLGLMAKRDLNDVIEGNLSIDKAITRYEEGGFDVLAGRSGHGSLSALPLQKLNEILQNLKSISKNYDIVVLDLGAGVDKTVRFLSGAANTMIAVTTDEPTSLTDVYALIKLSHAAGTSDNIQVVVNNALPKDAESTYATLSKACKNFLKIDPPLLGVIRHDKRVKEAIRAQVPFMTRSPNSEAAEDMNKIAKSVLELMSHG